MNLKRAIGIIALVIVAISFFAWAMLIFTGAAFDDNGFSVWVPIIFFSFAASGVTAFVCLIGDIIMFVGKMFANGVNSGTSFSVNNNVKFCSKCGKRLEANATFCSACGQKQP